MPSSQTAHPRERADRCPGVIRTWPADDGMLARIRLVGGRISPDALRALSSIAATYGDGRVHPTSRANLQLRGLPGGGERLDEEVVRAIAAAGLLPSRAHDLVRNIMLSPLTGRSGGRADLWPVASRLDLLVLASARLADLPGKFLFVLDDGRGDLVGRAADLGVVALDDRVGQLRVGSDWGEIVDLADAPEALVALAHSFLDARGSDASSAWHVDELAAPLLPATAPDHRVPKPAAPLPFGRVPGGFHHGAYDDGLDQSAVDALTATLPPGTTAPLVVTPWRGVLVPDEASAPPSPESGAAADPAARATTPTDQRPR